MKKTFYLFLGLFLAGSVSVLAISGLPSATQKSVRVQPNSATNTTTALIPSVKVYSFDADFQQGVCLKIKDKSGDGFSYLSVEDGVLNVGVTSCE